jgi:hypothetical protein
MFYENDKKKDKTLTNKLKNPVFELYNYHPDKPNPATVYGICWKKSS